MTITDSDARELLGAFLRLIREMNAPDVLAGIDETRRLGIEEELSEGKDAALKQVARTRRRPPNDLEMLKIVMETLEQRLIVLPMLADSIEKRLGANDLQWRVDTEFSSVDRFPAANLSDLRPQGSEAVRNAFMKLADLMKEAEEA